MTEHEVAAEADETVALLAPPSPRKTNGDQSCWRVVLIVAALDLILNSTSQLTLVPSTAILQDIVCAKYYANVRLDPSISYDDRCKIEPVQSEVAYINAWKDSFEVLPALLLAVPFGALSDRVGRKFVFLLALSGCFMSDVWVRMVYWFPDIFPLRAVWLSGVWQTMGGGSTTLTSIGYVLIADACPPEQRTTAFSYVQAGLILSRLIFVPIGGSFQDPWLAMWISSAMMIAGFFIAFVLLPSSRKPPSEPSTTTTTTTLRSHLQSLLSTTTSLTRWLTLNGRILPLLLTFFLFQFGESANGTLLLQYAAKRLGWSLGSTSYLISLSAATHLLVLALLIPLLSCYLLRTHALPEVTKDQRLAQISAVFLITGTGIVSLASSWVLFTFGWLLASLGLAFSIPTRSVITTMVEGEHLGVLYTAVSVLTYGGALAGWPACAALFRLGMRLGDRWVGMPFLVATGCFVLCLGGVSVVRPGGKAVDEGEGGGDEEEAAGLLERRG